MKTKTCEEYVLNELDRLQKENESLSQRVKELEATKETVSEDSDFNSYEQYQDDIVKSGFVCYGIDTLEGYSYGDYLKPEQRTTEILNNALETDDGVDSFIKQKYKCYGDVRNVGRIKEYKYLYRIEHRDTVVCLDIYDKNSENTFIIDNKNYFDNYELAYEGLKEKVRSDIRYYIKNYKENTEAKDKEKINEGLHL